VADTSCDQGEVDAWVPVPALRGGRAVPNAADVAAALEGALGAGAGTGALDAGELAAAAAAAPEALWTRPVLDAASGAEVGAVEVNLTPRDAALTPAQISSQFGSGGRLVAAADGAEAHAELAALAGALQAGAAAAPAPAAAPTAAAAGAPAAAGAALALALALLGA
jgi:pyruvate dehydrogenase E2 component (dihydrolipoamide acetyltransferase)